MLYVFQTAVELSSHQGVIWRDSPLGFSFSSRWHCSARKGPTALHLTSQQSLYSSFLQATSAVMLWPVRVQKVPHTSEHLCPAKLQTRCDICCACQPICPFIPTDSGMPRTVDPGKSLQLKTVHGCVPFLAAHRVGRTAADVL